jgi:glycosyltransferase involved in cell wall biosynthesis
MNIWILQTGEPLQCDDDSPRPMRAMNLSNTLVSKGHNVIIWSSSFNHSKKTHRSKKFTSIVMNENLTINLISSFGYKKNISLARLFDHFILALNLRKALSLNQFEKPDVVFVGFPPIETAYVMLDWAKKNSIPSVIDVKDQWPQIFIEAFPSYLKSVAKVFFSIYFQMAKKSFELATVHCSMTSSYISWMAEIIHDNKKKGIVVPLTTKRIEATDNEIAIAKDWWIENGVNLNNRRRFIFVGSLSPVFDFFLIQAIVQKFEDKKIACQFVICGDGNSAIQIKELFAGYSNVLFPGWVDSVKIKVLADASSGSLAPYKNTIDFTNSIPNKIIDALALGLPIITSLDGVVKQLVLDNNIGFFLNYENVEEVFENLQKMIIDSDLFNKISNNCLKCYDRKFDYNFIYGNLVKELELLAK